MLETQTHNFTPQNNILGKKSINLPQYLNLCVPNY